MTVSEDSSVPITQLLRSWAVIMLLLAGGAYLLGGDDSDTTLIEILVPATVIISFGLLAWRYGVEG